MVILTGQWDGSFHFIQSVCAFGFLRFLELGLRGKHAA
jgi:hypothetical protein